MGQSGQEADPKGSANPLKQCYYLIKSSRRQLQMTVKSLWGRTFFMLSPVFLPHVLCCFHSSLLPTSILLFNSLCSFPSSHSVCCFSSTFHLPPSLSFMKVKDGLVVLAYSAVCVMNESCLPRESEGTVVYTAGYRLMFSYGEGGKCREDGGGD